MSQCTRVAARGHSAFLEGCSKILAKLPFQFSRLRWGTFGCGGETQRQRPVSQSCGCTPRSHGIHLGPGLELRPRGTELGLTPLEEGGRSHVNWELKTGKCADVRENIPERGRKALKRMWRSDLSAVMGTVHARRGQT